MNLFIKIRKKLADNKVVKGWLLKRMIHDYPLAISIEVTNRCNLECGFCPRASLRKEQGFMDRALFESIIDNIRRDRRKVHLLLHNFGEPLLHPELCRFIAYAKRSGVARSVTFNSNGLLLTPDLSKALIESGVDEITLSLDALDDESYALLKGADLQKVNENFLNFIRLRKMMGSRKPHLRVKMMVKQCETDNTEPFLSRWQGVADSTTIDWYSNFGGLLAPDIDMPERVARYACTYLWYRMVIGWDGTVVPCCVDINDDRPLGSLKVRMISELWNGERMRKIRASHLTGNYNELPLCRECTDWLHQPNIEKSLRRTTVVKRPLSVGENESAPK